MIRAWAIVLAVVCLLAFPVSGAQGIQDTLADAEFEQVGFRIRPDSIDVAADGFLLQGRAASELRSCIDAGPCPISEFRLIAPGNDDGQVDTEEVERFRELVLNLWNSVPELRLVSEELRAMVSIDGRTSDAVSLVRFEVSGAPGPASAFAPIELGFGLRGEFRSTSEAATHEIKIERTESDLTISQRFVIQAGDGWKIDPASITPTELGGLYSRGGLSGSQQEFEGAEPLTFTIQEDAGNVGLWIGVSAGGLVAAVAAAAVVVKRRKG